MALDTEAVSAELLAVLRCPVSGQSLGVAPAAVIDRLETARSTGSLVNHSGAIIKSAITAGLVNADGSVFYLVSGGLPVVLAGEAISVK